MTTRTILFTSVYVETGDEIERTERVEVRDDLAVLTDVERDDYLMELLWPLTGTGRTKGDAGYFVESTDNIEPAINLEWC